MRWSNAFPKLGLAALVVVCLPLPESRAQTSTEDRSVGSLRSGDWALQFQIAENFLLTSFDGLMISLERHWSPRSALRFGVDSDVGSTDQDSRMDAAADSLVSSVSSRSGSSDSESATLKIDYVSYSNPEGRLHFYWAAGPNVTFSRSHAEQVSTSTRGDWVSTFRETTEGHAWGTALAGALGVQWFATRGLGFLAEYGASAGYDFGKASTVRTSESTTSPAIRGNSEDKHHAFRFDSLGVRLGVSVLF